MHAFEMQPDELPRRLAGEILFSDVPLGHWHGLPTKIREARYHDFQYTRIHVQY
jgi:hypothetical protein